ncbi:hypothetical protein M9978_13300, partial [Sphingomonas sp. MG17]
EDRLGQIQSDNRHLLHLHSPSPTYPQKNIPRGGEPSTTSIVDIPSYGIVNLRVMWASEDNKYTAQVFVTNALNKDYFVRMNDAIFSSGAVIAQMGEPRLWGVKLGAAF